MRTRQLLPLLLLLLAAATLRAQTPPLAIERVADSVYIFTTWQSFKGTAFPSNSMYVVTPAGVVLVDTPWDTTQTAPLLDTIAARHGQRVVLCIATHFHADRSGGLDQFRARGIATWTSRLTRELAAAGGHPVAEHVFTADTTFTVGGVAVEAFYPGEGHTRDNIVVWLPAVRLLYGGCFIKSTEAPDLGNVADASVGAWERSLLRTIERYPRPTEVIPGHQGWASRRGLEHTLELVRAATK